MALRELLAESPIESSEAIKDANDFIEAGEWGLALDHICVWIYEDGFKIERDYYGKLVEMAVELGTERSVNNLHELLRLCLEASIHTLVFQGGIPPRHLGDSLLYTDIIQYRFCQSKLADGESRWNMTPQLSHGTLMSCVLR